MAKTSKHKHGLDYIVYVRDSGNYLKSFYMNPG